MGGGSMVPRGMSFRSALAAGYVEAWRSRPYLTWVKSLPCVVCAGAQGASDPHHVTGMFRGTGKRAPDCLVLPLCRVCHEQLHAAPKSWEAQHGDQLMHALMALTQAIHQGVLGVGGGGADKDP